MHTLIFVHVILLSISIIATISATSAAVFGVRIPKLLTKINITLTTIGIAAGVGLLADKPLDMRCALLTAYLVMFMFAQAYIYRRNRQLAASSI